LWSRRKVEGRKEARRRENERVGGLVESEGKKEEE
jgi:hypothetical protein